MSKQALVKKEIQHYPVNKPIYINKLYQTKFAAVMNELTYYKAIERLTSSNSLAKMAKGIYCKPRITKYGTVLPSDREIIKLFTEKNKGTIVGYSLYNALNITTQIAKRHEVYSSSVEPQTLTMGNVFIKKIELEYTESTIKTIHMMEVLQNYHEIQDLNAQQFLVLCAEFVNYFNEDIFEKVMKNIRYKKRTIAFLKNILDYFQIANSLDKYLSVFSEYNYPRMETIYKTASIH